ncbi:UDP-glycosyltransferase 73D1-like protein [Trifolium pratense]|uniref:UDP-glycosyltransferase 73D1-like protein n=1 Tax=Trifolium pratense TaxID=57577 RepID=A0A2K3PCL7_TRIPR|nr:UDP-glycosyltransferase 73D1-like protein [Trifolium pratense]
MSCFSLLSSYNIKLHNAHCSVNSDSDPFVIPGFMPQKIEITRSQLPGTFVPLPDLDDYREKMHEAEISSYGIVVNSYEELEQGCAQEYEKVMNKRVYCIVRFGDEKKIGMLVKKSRVVEVIEMCMEGGVDGEKRRCRAKELGNLATKALEVDEGSSYFNISCLIRDIMKHQSA